MPDDLGRDCIRRRDARRLLDEQRAHQLQVAARARVAEAEAVEADQLRRRQIWGGIPVAALPGNMSATEAMLQASAEDRPRRKNPVAAALDGEGLTFHSYAKEE